MTDHHASRQLRRFSQPFVILLSIALGLLVLFEITTIAAILFLFHGDGAWRAAVSFSQSGVNLSIGSASDQAGHGVALESLAFGQRALIALLGALCATCSGFALFHLRQLFTLYSRGVVFAEDNIRHIKRFGLWLVAAAIVINGSGRLFLIITGQPPFDTANAAMALVYGGMTYVMARVMELGRQADLERKEFI